MDKLALIVWMDSTIPKGKKKPETAKEEQNNRKRRSRSGWIRNG